MDDNKKLLRTELVGFGKDADGEFETYRDVFADRTMVTRTVREGQATRKVKVQVGAVVVNMEVK